MDHYANVVLTVEGRCWRMIVPHGLAKMRHPTKLPGAGVLDGVATVGGMVSGSRSGRAKGTLTS